MTTRVGVVFMALLLVLYLALLGQRAVILVASGDPIGVTMGVALMVLPLLGAWALVREVLFGDRTQRMAETLAEEGGLPVDDLPKLASGRPVRAAADAIFPQYRAEVDAAPDDWRAWFRLGLAYDASGDRRRARSALRRSIGLWRAAAR